jgi:hypothetical protein
MEVHESSNRLLQLLAYSIVIAALVISVAYPLVLQFTGPYAAPPAANANWIVTAGHVVDVNTHLPLPNAYWRSAISYENQYPVPSIILSILMLITSIPSQYAMFIPLAAIGNIIYFVLARYILKNVTSNKSYVLLFSALYYLFFVAVNIQATTAGRAVFGLTLFTFFIYLYLRFLNMPSASNFKLAPYQSVVTLLLFSIVIGYTYYFSTVDIIGLMLLVAIGIFFTRNIFPRKHSWLEFSILILLVFLFLGTETVSVTSQFTNPSAFFSNVVQYFGMLFDRFGIHISGVTPTLWNVDLISYNSFISFWYRFATYIRYTSIISVVACLLVYTRKNQLGNSKTILWLFSLFLVFATSGEIAYLTSGPQGPERLLLLYGPIVTISLIILIPTKRQALKWLKRLLIITMAVSLCFGIWGAFQYTWSYTQESGRPFTYNNVYPVSQFILSASNSSTPFILTGDAYYTANLFFIASLYNRTVTVIPEPLENDSVSLNTALTTGNLEGFLVSMNQRQIKYLLLANDGRPLYGDAWGYIVESPNPAAITNLTLSRIYDDGQTKLFQLPPLTPVHH